ncbi:hypothetical protein LG200_07590 [Methylobacillus caricis]|uniref:hypothetical protein n=1 Tax=Methylobacillus caricis TaxID=1971611 RepID=UPI001D000726|nr:hypothetical protein [Methylobacillus caricis]MCB5187866.1 hypothetical protein [Methylobacillus caricis]
MSDQIFQFNRYKSSGCKVEFALMEINHAVPHPVINERPHAVRRFFAPNIHVMARDLLASHPYWWIYAFP